jgi:hypothetical protein
MTAMTVATTTSIRPMPRWFLVIMGPATLRPR